MQLLKKELLMIIIIFGVVNFCENVQTKISKFLGQHPGLIKGPVFTIVRFLNIPCTSPNGQMSGTCFSLNDCVRMQGSQIGTCASGFGVCCVFQRTCGAASGQNSTHFVNPGYPHEIMEHDDTMCTFTLLRPVSVNVCQIRLDFIDFEIARPTEGNCLDDRFSVLGSNSNAPIPEVCGRNNGQHMYLDVENTMGPIFLTISTKGVGKRRWNIKISYIECNNPSKAPSSCLQYYVGSEGKISSFNYESGETGYLNNLDYAICFRKEVNRCSISYIADDIESFSILNLNPETDSPTVGAGEAGLGIDECPMDYLRLGGDRYCGARLNPSISQPNPDVNAPVTDNTTGPFIAYFKTDSTNNAAGFNLKFKQNACV